MIGFKVNRNVSECLYGLWGERDRPREWKGLYIPDEPRTMERTRRGANQEGREDSSIREEGLSPVRLARALSIEKGVLGPALRDSLGLPRGNVGLWSSDMGIPILLWAWPSLGSHFDPHPSPHARRRREGLARLKIMGGRLWRRSLLFF